MDGPSHYAEAERLLGLVKTGQASLAEPWSTSVLDQPDTGPAAALAAAQVHATLALAAAQVFGYGPPDEAAEQQWLDAVR